MVSTCQTVIRDGEVIRPGDMDTPAKFDQLTEGIDLKDKRILDVGCNFGTMCHIATSKGALAVGVDINRDYIEQAREFFPDLDFRCINAEGIYGNYDIIIASAMLHYVNSLDVVFKAFARCGKQVICDVWLNDRPGPVFTLSHRNIFIPSETAFKHIVSKYFKTIENKGLALTPDQSVRHIFHISDPIPNSPEAILIYGKGATGKTTLSKTYFNHTLVTTEDILTSWLKAYQGKLNSIKWNAELARGYHKSEYIDYYLHILTGRLIKCVNRDVVIEGYDLMFDDFRELVIELLKSKGWRVELIETEKSYPKEYI